MAKGRSLYSVGRSIKDKRQRPEYREVVSSGGWWCDGVFGVKRCKQSKESATADEWKPTSQ